MQQTQKNLEARRIGAMDWLDKRFEQTVAALETIPRQPEELAYLAGLFDGEGCISISFNRNYRGVTTGICAGGYTVGVSVSMCNEPIIRWIHERFPGSSFVYVRHKHPNRMQAYRVCFKEATGSALLKLIYPYMRVKKQQAALFFKFVEVKKQARFRADSHRAALVYELFLKIKSFNRKPGPEGKKVGPKPNQGAVETERCAPNSNWVKFQSELVGDSEKVSIGNELTI